MSSHSFLPVRSVTRAGSLLALALALPLATQFGACVDPTDDSTDAPLCTLRDCNNGVSLGLAPGKLLREAACARGPLTMRVCAGSFCAEAELSVYGLCTEATSQGGPRLGCNDVLGRPGDSDAATPPLSVGLDLRADVLAGPQPVSVALRSASGEVLYQGQQSVLFEEKFPNGKECGGSCWRGEVAAFDLSAALAGLGEGCNPERPGEGGGGQGGQGGQGGSGPGGAGGQGGQGGAAGSGLGGAGG